MALCREAGMHALAHRAFRDESRGASRVATRVSQRPLQPLAVETVDILPTLASLVGVAIDPETIDGRCLDLVEGPASSCLTETPVTP